MSSSRITPPPRAQKRGHEQVADSPIKIQQLSNHPDFLVGSLNASRSAILDDIQKVPVLEIEALVQATVPEAAPNNLAQTLSDLATIIDSELASFEILLNDNSKTEKEAFVPIENIINNVCATNGSALDLVTTPAKSLNSFGRVNTSKPDAFLQRKSSVTTRGVFLESGRTRESTAAKTKLSAAAALSAHWCDTVTAFEWKKDDNPESRSDVCDFTVSINEHTSVT
jgi:hypothetical protein